MDDLFVVKEFNVQSGYLDDLGDSSAPKMPSVMLQMVCAVGGESNLQGSPLMVLTPQIARELGQRLLREAKAAIAQAPSEKTKRH